MAPQQSLSMPTALAHVFIARGALFLTCGMVAVAWPEQALIPALLIVAAFGVLGGMYELSIAIMKTTAPGRRLIIGHSLAMVVFGLLTAGVTGPEWPIPLIATMLWLLIYAGICLSAITVLPKTPVKTLAAFGVFNALLAILIDTLPDANVFALLYFGAMYAAALGAFQLGVAWWLTHRAVNPPSTFDSLTPAGR